MRFVSSSTRTTLLERRHEHRRAAVACHHDACAGALSALDLDLDIPNRRERVLSMSSKSLVCTVVTSCSHRSCSRITKVMTTNSRKGSACG